jgi:hypothetical protein
MLADYRYRIKYKNLWIAIVIQDYGFAGNVALSICRSKRAQNDWFCNRKNRRARRAARIQNVSDLKCWATCARLMRLVLDHTSHPLFIYPEDNTRDVLMRYAERWGFEKGSDNVWVRVSI